jgi:hypothetical protein
VASFWTLSFGNKTLCVTLVSGFSSWSKIFGNVHWPFTVEANHAGVEGGNDMRRKNITGRQLAYWRNQYRWTQKTLAARLQCLGFGISREMVANIEAGLRGVEDNWLVGFQKVFRLPVIRFFPQEIQDSDADYCKCASGQLSDSKPPKTPRRKCQKLTKRPKEG